MSPCIEIVIYKVKDRKVAKALCEDARAIISAFPGFRSWQALTSFDDETTLADIVTWSDLASAKAAGEAVQKEPRLAPFMAEITETISMGHYE